MIEDKRLSEEEKAHLESVLSNLEVKLDDATERCLPGTISRGVLKAVVRLPCMRIPTSTFSVGRSFTSSVRPSGRELRKVRAYGGSYDDLTLIATGTLYVTNKRG